MPSVDVVRKHLGLATSVEIKKPDIKWYSDGCTRPVPVVVKTHHNEIKVTCPVECLMVDEVVFPKSSLVKYEPKDASWAVYFGIARVKKRPIFQGEEFDLATLGGSWRGKALLMDCHPVNRQRMNEVKLELFLRDGANVPVSFTLQEMVDLGLRGQS